MNIAQYTDKLKAIVPSSVKLPVNVNMEALPSFDIRQLLISCGGVVCFYAAVLGYVHFSAESTIAKMEANMATISVELTEKAPSQYGIGRHNSPKSDVDPHEMEKANLIEGLSQYDDMFGRLPVIRSGDHLTSFRAYQPSFSLQDIGKKPAVSFVLKDFGMSDEVSNMALDILPPEISFLVSPYDDLPQEWINRARSAGHEVWMEIPVQRDGHNDTGLNTIYHHESIIEKGKAMRTSLARGLGYVGVGIFMDKGVSQTKEHYIKLAEELYGRGLAILEMNPKAPTFIEAMAITKAAPFIKTTKEIERITGTNPFLSVEKEAKESGNAVAVINPNPVMIKDLALWIEKIGKIDYVVLPVSAIYDLPLARAGAVSAVQAHHGDLGNNDLVQPEESNDHHGH